MSSVHDNKPDLDDTVWWRNQAQVLAKEAALAARALQALLADGSDAPLLMIPLPPPGISVISPSTDLVYNIEESKRHDDRYFLRGWAFVSSSENCRDTTFGCILRTEDDIYAVPVVRLKRPDVAAVFPTVVTNCAERSHAGFFCQFDSRFVTSPAAHAFLVLRDAGHVHCSGAIPLGA